MAARDMWQALANRPLQALAVAATIAVTVGLLASPHYPFAVLPAAAIVSLFLLSRFPEVGYLLILLLIPFDAYRSLSAGLPMLTLSKLIGLWLVILLFFRMLVRRDAYQRLRCALWPGLLAFAVVAFVSALLSAYPETSWNAGRQLMASYLFFALTLFFAANPRMFSSGIPWTITTGVTIGCIFSLAGYIFSLPSFAIGLDRETLALKRGTGVANDPNTFAAAVIFVLPVLVHMIVTATSARRRLGIFVLIALHIAALVVSYSRGAAVVLMVVFLVLAFEHLPKTRVQRIGVVVVPLGVLVVAAALLIPSSYWERQRSVTEAQDESIQSRFSYLLVARDIVMAHPLLGAGLGAFPDVYADSTYGYALSWGKDREEGRRLAHNTYAEVAAGTGLLGLAVFMGILALSWRSFNRSIGLLDRQGNRVTASLVRAYRTSWISLLVYFLMMSHVTYKLIWVSLALSQVALAIAERDAEPESDEHLRVA